MKFITEDDLRDLYKKEPFTTYEIEQEARLTPGARQFLADRAINLFHHDSLKKKNIETEKQSNVQGESKHNWKTKKLHRKMKSMVALFLLTGEELLSRDVCLTQKVINLSKQFSDIKNAMEKKESVENLCCQECTGIKADHFCDDLDDCFEITEFHMQLEKGKEIILLNRLRCELHEIEPMMIELCEGSDDENQLYEEAIGRINKIINSLSQMICIAVGGKECQRKS